MSQNTPTHGGPNSWKELRTGLKNRKKTINQRNQQVRGLKGEIGKLRSRYDLLKNSHEAILERLWNRRQSCCSPDGSPDEPPYRPCDECLADEKAIAQANGK